MKYANLILRSKEKNSSNLLRQMFGLTLVMLLLAGCGGAQAESTTIPTYLPLTSTPIPTSIPTVAELVDRFCISENDGHCGIFMFVAISPEALRTMQYLLDVKFDGDVGLYLTIVEKLGQTTGVLECSPDETSSDCEERTMGLCFPEVRDGELHFPEQQNGQSCRAVACYLPATPPNPEDQPNDLDPLQPLVLVQVGQAAFED